MCRVWACSRGSLWWRLNLHFPCGLLRQRDEWLECRPRLYCQQTERGELCWQSDVMVSKVNLAWANHSTVYYHTTWQAALVDGGFKWTNKTCIFAGVPSGWVHSVVQAHFQQHYQQNEYILRYSFLPYCLLLETFSTFRTFGWEWIWKKKIFITLDDRP